MWFSLFSTVLVLAVTFYQGLQGLFTGLINCILAMLSAALAFGLYENIYFSFLADRQPDFGRPIALVGLFVITLLVLRAIFDGLIKGNVHFQVYVDRAGGGLFGFITAMIIVGMLSIGFQMLPFPPDFMGFSRFTLVDESGKQIPWAPENKKDANPLPAMDFSKVSLKRQRTWLNAGGFTSSLASLLSSNSLRGRDDLSFGEVHPDFLAEVYYAKTNPLGPSRLTAKPGSLAVTGYWDMPANSFYTRERKDFGGKPGVKLNKAEALESGSKYWVARVKVTDARDESSDVVRFTPEQVRLLARTSSNGPLKVFTLAGINEEVPAAQNKLVQLYPGEPISRPDNSEMDFVFRVPDKPEFAPVYIEFKQDARSEVKNDRNDDLPPPIGTKAPKSGKKPGRKASPADENPDQNGGETGGASNDPKPKKIKPGKPADRPADYGRVAVLGPAQEITVSDALPFQQPLTTYGGQSEISSGTIRAARHMVADLDSEWQPIKGSQPPAEKFQVPDDKRLVQVSVERLQAGSMLGRAKSFAVENIGDFYMKDAKTKEHRPVGVYGMATVSGKKTFELIYLDESERDFARLPKLTRIHGTDFKGEYALVYLFIVPPGTQPTEVHTGGTSVDLKPFNITVK